MARTLLQASRENAKCIQWSLHSSFLSEGGTHSIIALRKGGFYAGHNSLEELKAFCLKNFNPIQPPLRPDISDTKLDDNARSKADNSDNSVSKLQKLEAAEQKAVELTADDSLQRLQKKEAAEQEVAKFKAGNSPQPLQKVESGEHKVKESTEENEPRDLQTVKSGEHEVKEWKEDDSPHTGEPAEQKVTELKADCLRRNSQEVETAKQKVGESKVDVSVPHLQKGQTVKQKVVESSHVEENINVSDNKNDQSGQDLLETDIGVKKPMAASFCQERKEVIIEPRNPRNEVGKSVTTRISSGASKFKRKASKSKSGDVPCAALDPSDRSSDPRREFHHDYDDSLGDDADVVPDFVDCFYVTDDNDKVISLFVLPHGSSTSEEQSPKERFYLHGKYDNGLIPVMCAITKWKLELGEKSCFSVKAQQGNWIRLGQPVKSYAAGELRTALLVEKFLSFVSLNHAASQQMVFAHLKKELRFSEVQPSLNDLLQHKVIIRNLSEQIPQLRDAPVIEALLNKKRKATDGKCSDGMEKRHKKNEECTFVAKEDIHNEKAQLGKEKISSSISSQDNEHSEIQSNEELDDQDDEDVGETICAICDDGGDILCCDGPCLRSFHASKGAAASSSPSCVSLDLTDSQVKEMNKFFCWNCLYKRHQCFVCGELGSSEGESKEVFVCDVALCGRFYHLECVSKMLVPVEEQLTFVEKIKTGSEAFSCPLHRCLKCRKGDIKGNDAMRLYGCRRCPRAWHKKCISNKVTFYEGDWIRGLRGWDINGMRFLYCLRHEMDEDLGTPVRSHLVFPSGPSIVEPACAISRLGEGEKVSREQSVPLSFKEDFQPKSIDQTTTRKVGNVESVGGMGSKSIQKSFILGVKKVPEGAKNITSPKSPRHCNEEVQMMIKSIIDMSKEVVTYDSVVSNLSIPSVYKEQKSNIKKSLCLGKLESILHALAKSRDCLWRGAVEEARCLCPEESIRILERSKTKLRVYLAPVLHGVRYTSYGRHFTKTEKLQEIVNRLHWYVNDGDTVVDFCCGSNEFSKLMVEKLTKHHKNCKFKNFDIIHPKHDFNFTKRDWLSVKHHELPSGGKLVMGLNPPFGTSAQLANTMVQHALTFKPKLLILIVPEETRRLESSGYECIWEDQHLLSGQAFYFPGSVDTNNKSLTQENLKAPPLYLWSRLDWAARHRQIAMEQGHLEKSVLPRSDISHTVPQFWSTKDFETKADLRGQDCNLLNNHSNVPPCDYMPPARAFETTKSMNVYDQHLTTGKLNLPVCVVDGGSHIDTQHCELTESSSHSRRLPEVWDKDSSGLHPRNHQEKKEIQEMPTGKPDNQHLELELHKNFLRAVQPALEEATRLVTGQPYLRCESGPDIRSFRPNWPSVRANWPPATFSPYPNLHPYDREDLEPSPDGHTGGWIEE